LIAFCDCPLGKGGGVKEEKVEKEEEEGVVAKGSRAK